MSAQLLISQGHDVTLHARCRGPRKGRAPGSPGAAAALAADLSSISQTRRLAAQCNELQPFDAVIHNAAVGYGEPRLVTEDGLEHVFAINTLAPYLLTALIARPRSLVI